MGIPYRFDPLGTLGGGWKEVDMSSFVSSNWDDLAAMTPPGLVPSGLPNGLVIETRNCIRSRAAEMLYFGYNNRSTNPGASYAYSREIPPPRAQGVMATPSLEFWVLGSPVYLRLEFTLSLAPTQVYATRNDWETRTDWEKVDVIVKEGVYCIETPFAAKSVIIKSGVGSVSGGITKIFTK